MNTQDHRLDSLKIAASTNPGPAFCDLTVFLDQRMGDYCIGMISSRWRAKGANVCGAGGL
jgi:hypothetical protein